MRKKVISAIFLFFIFSIVSIYPLSVNGFEINYIFSEIGSIDPGHSIINLQCIDNELAFVLNLDNNLVVFDVTDSSNAIELDSVYLYHPHDIELDLDRELVFATAFNGISILDYSNTSDLNQLSTYSNYTYSTFIFLQNELLFVGAEDSGLQIVNVTDPYNPYMIGNWSDPTGDIGQVYVMSNYAFVATRIPDISGPPTYQDLKVLDVSDPSNISYISTVDLGGSFNGGAPRAHNNDLVFFNDHAFGLKILDFSNPLDVSIIGNFSDGGFYNDVELVDDEIAFLADDYFGLKVVNCSVVTNPTLMGTHELLWRTLRVVVKDSRIYLATLNGGVRILSFAIETMTASSYPLWIVSGLLITCSVLKFTMNRKRKTP